MKKLLVLALAVFGFGTAVFAQSPCSFIYKLNDEKTFEKLSHFLLVDSEQRESLQFVFSEAEKKLEKETANGAVLGEAINKAIYFNLANAKAVLSEEQYRKFVSIINLSINNENERELLAAK